MAIQGAPTRAESLVSHIQDRIAAGELKAGDNPEALLHALARLLVSGSAPLPVPVFQQLRQLTGSAPIVRYGMTETLVTVSTRFDGDRRPGWVGSPIDGTHLCPSDALRERALKNQGRGRLTLSPRAAAESCRPSVAKDGRWRRSVLGNRTRPVARSVEPAPKSNGAPPSCNRSH
jgi:acyl-coenzyme A synthetase/AMP-(fatty) acid ligase